MPHFDLVSDVALLVVGPLWVGTVAAVGRDAQARVSNPAAVRVAVAVATLVPLAGALIWFCLRPPETLLERRERRLRLRLAEEELGERRAPVAFEGGRVSPVAAPATPLPHELRHAAGMPV